MRKFWIILLVFCLLFVLTGCFTGSQEPDYFYLEKPSGLNFDFNTKTLSWNAVPHANEYWVEYWGTGSQSATYSTNATNITFQTDETTPVGDVDIVFFYFHVRAVGYTRGKTTYFSNEQNYSDANFSYVLWVRLTPPEGITFNRETGRLSWNAVENAENYIVHYDAFQTLTQTSTNTYYDFGHTFDDVTPVKFTVQACSTDPYFRESIVPPEKDWVASYLQLAKPAVSFDGNYLSWTAVPNAEYYYVECTVSPNIGANYTVTNSRLTETRFSNPSSTAKSLSFRIQARANSYASSDYVTYTWYRP